MVTTRTEGEISAFAKEILWLAGTRERSAELVALSIALAEADGIRSHGLMRLPTYLDHLQCGKVDGQAIPSILNAESPFVQIDANHGFAQPAIELGLEVAVDKARQAGVAAMSVTNSYNCGVLGQFVEKVAHLGLISIAVANSPACVAPWGGAKPVFGTNPIAFGAPRDGRPPLVIDQSSTRIARGEIMLAANEGRQIPEGWAIDAGGSPTTDPKIALKGSLLPSGDHKGTGLAIIVEVLAAVLTGSTLSSMASSFGDSNGGPPSTGQFFILLDPARSAPRFAKDMETLIGSIISQPGARLPGGRRLQTRLQSSSGGISISSEIMEALEERKSRLIAQQRN